ncbi:hypothetical protein PHYSODRAFT_530006, partial [Phytophthora sojae]
VCRRWPSVEALPHAVELIRTFTEDISKRALTNLLERGEPSLFFQVLQAVDESKNLAHHEKLRQYRLAMYLIPSKMTLKQGKLEAMKELYRRYRNSVDDRTIQAASETPELPVLKWLHSCQPKMFKIFSWCEEKIFECASMEGRAEVVRWLVKLFPDAVRSLEFAAAGGHTDLTKWLMKHTKWATDSLEKWLHENRSEGCTTNAMNSAANRGHLDVVKWLHANRTEGCTSQAMEASFFCTGKGILSKETVDEAASHGCLEVVKFLHEHRVFEKGCTKSAMTKAAHHNHLDVIKWLRTNRRKTNTVQAMDAAATRGHLQVVKWLHENGQGGCTASALSLAADGGYLKIVKFLAANYSLDWSEKAIAYAQSHGHTETANWLHFHLGMKLLPFLRNPTVFYTGDGNKHPEVVQWYKDHYGNPRKRRFSD